MIVTKMGSMGCKHSWDYQESANTQLCLKCGRCEIPDP